LALGSVLSLRERVATIAMDAAVGLDRPGPAQWELANRVRSGRKQR